MIRCDTEAERKALADLLWAVKDVLLMRKSNNTNPVVKDLAKAFHRLFKVGDLEL